MNNEQISSVTLEKIRNDIGFALGILVGLKAIEPKQMEYAMEQARESLFKALEELPSNKSTGA